MHTALPDIIKPLQTNINEGSISPLNSIIGSDTLPQSAKASELLQCAVCYGKTEIAEELIKKGVPLDAPPKTLSMPNIESNSNSGYIEAPYIIQATAKGHLGMIQCLCKHKRSLNELGHIGFSPKFHNSIITNCLGAAAFHGHTHIVKWILSNSKELTDSLQIQCKEEYNERAELNGFTPILLGIVGRGDTDMVRLFMENDIKWNSSDVCGGSLVHACVEYDKIDILKFLISPKIGMNPFKKNEQVYS